jgi:hypothetical protein
MTFPRVVEVDGPKAGSLEARASLVFKILAGFNLAGFVFAIIPASIPVSAMHALAFNAAAVGLAGLYLFEARRIDRLAPWAIAIVRPLLLLIAAASVYLLLTAIAAGRIKLPFEAALAAWALLGKPSVEPTPRPERRGVALIGATVALAAVTLFGRYAFDWGGLFDLHEADLVASVDVDCGPPGAPPDTIAVGYDWSWTSATLLPNAVDVVVVGWAGADADGRPLYVIGAIPDPDPASGIRPGVEDYPSADMADQVAGESQGSFRWGLDLAKQRYQPARIEVTLRRTAAVAPQTSTLTVSVTYVHLGLWRHTAETVTCTW